MASSRPPNARTSYEERQRKRLKLQDSLKADALAAARDLVSQLEMLEARMQLNHTGRSPSLEGRVKDLRAVLTVFLRKGGECEIALEFLDLQFPNVEQLGVFIEACVNAYHHFRECYSKHKSPKPSPSDYALNWPSMVIPNLLCGRPPEKRGLPLSTLHDAFREFILQANSLLPLGCPLAIRALQAAAGLCHCMGESFTNDSERSSQFDKCVQGLFPSWRSKHHLNPPGDVSAGHVLRRPYIRVLGWPSPGSSRGQG